MRLKSVPGQRVWASRSFCLRRPGRPQRAVRGEPARRRLDRLPAAPAGGRQALALGPGPDGDHGGRAGPPGGPWAKGAHPRRGTGRARRLMGDGGGPAMLFPERRRRRTVGRPGRARLHRHPPPCGRGRAAAGALLAGAPPRHGELERRPHALADRQRSVAAPSLRPESAGSAGLGRRAVPRPRLCAGTLERRP